MQEADKICKEGVPCPGTPSGCVSIAQRLTQGIQVFIQLFLRLCEKYLDMYVKKVRGLKPDTAEYAQAKRVYDEITALSKI